MDKYQGLFYVIIVVYNVGFMLIVCWQMQWLGFDLDIWIEIISYKEICEYVVCILVFSVIYDWCFNGDVLLVSDCMNGCLQVRCKSFMCVVNVDKGGD